MKAYLLSLFLFCVLFQTAWSRGSGECVQLCNDLRFDVLNLGMCREAKRTLPRPKVGDFCTTAMEQGFSDACVPLCMDQQVVNRVAQTCRSAAIEMPRPTVRRWCEHGYNVAFQKTIEDLTAYFKPELKKPEAHFDTEHPIQEEQVIAKGEENLAVYKDSNKDNRAVLATIPITLDDGTTKDLIVHDGQNAEEAVVEFCRENVPNEVSTCIRQLLNVAIEKLSELNANA
jgi:hypothetical protein